MCVAQRNVYTIKKKEENKIVLLYQAVLMKLICVAFCVAHHMDMAKRSVRFVAFVLYVCAFYVKILHDDC